MVVAPPVWLGSWAAIAGRSMPCIILSTKREMAMRAPVLPALTQASAAARAVRDDVLVLCHGGPIATPDDARFILRECRGCDGFYGASSMERLPTEVALTATTRAFKAIR